MEQVYNGHSRNHYNANHKYFRVYQYLINSKETNDRITIIFQTYWWNLRFTVIIIVIEKANKPRYNFIS